MDCYKKKEKEKKDKNESQWVWKRDLNRPFFKIKARSFWDMYSRVKLKTLIIHGTVMDDEGRAS